MILITLLVVIALCWATDSLTGVIALMAALLFVYQPLWLIDLLTFVLFGSLWPLRR